MEFATFRGLYTLFLIIIFVALIAWAYSKEHKKTFDNIANSIFDEDQDSIKYAGEQSRHTGAKK
ncbi:CcoQ/FixQ family Cbb3-type cytochrome c oxidase assembly chaperone [Psychromonas sp. MB-3u-54]|uniref:cbb3-type cytochrome oxidase subunit 3 n=1 Tax=Psychromonas sp. MB-3u-54 TaxID=2058319 RepID=UPI000C34EE60|nr:CcoQ/FixQ family Cbb3-type cytochrome c oxidase assembly chaperone [Psychromonas sp. MB-3u-54]PKH04138.1 CcoQ/FixQ family Cbb3-type cytochrome c oxidase assembly chaperone [Psychromonas sp. MB-3u-54]